MRRLLSILLLVVFGLPIALPMLALGQDAEDGLPACCRRNGKHHCLMSMAAHGKLVSHDPQFRAPAEKCPFYPGGFTPSQPNPLAAPFAAILYGELVSHPAGLAQVEARLRISRDRSHGKRGPPTLTTL